MRNASLIARRAIWVLIPFLLCPTPAQAVIHGGIEIGAKGVKATVIDAIPGKKQGLSVKILLSGTANTTLSAGIAADGKFDPKALLATAAAVKKYAEEMEKKYKVPSDNIYVVASSGIFSPIEKDVKAVAARREELGKAIRTATGRTMDYINVQQESQLSIVGIIPRQYLDVALLIDIGSGNTKGGCRAGPKKYITFGVPYGSVTFSELIKKRFGKDDSVKGGARAAAEVLRPALRDAVKEHAGLAGRDRVYLSGGAVWAMATFTRPTDRASYVALTAKDVEAYHQMLTARPGEYPTPDLTSGTEDARKAAEKDLKRIRGVFTPAQLLAGADILKALSSEFKLGEKKLYFPRNGYLGWILAYAALKTKTP
jgi:exopolyphosphatase/pppGpp-phosphohydrolase